MADVTVVMKGVDDASAAIGSVTDALGGLATVAAGVAAAGLAALGTGLAFSLSAAMDSEKIQASLAQTIKSTGGAAGLTADAANALAQQFTNLAGGSDDAILAIEEIGLRAGTVSAEAMPAFIQATLDLGTVMGDTAAAATLLARAQDDPEAAFKRIERATGAYDSALEDQIKLLVQQGDKTGAVDLIMNQLAETTGGAAAAAAGTLAGQFEIVKGTIGEAAETIGTAFLPVAKELFDNVIAPAIPLITQLGEAIGYVIGDLLSGDFGVAIDDIRESILTFGEALGLPKDQLMAFNDKIFEAFNFIKDNAPGLVSSFQSAITPIIEGAGSMAQAFIDSMPKIEQTVASMVAFVTGQMAIFAPVLTTNVGAMLEELGVFWSKHSDFILFTIELLFRTAVAVFGGAFTLLSGLVAAGLQVINGNWSGALETMNQTLLAFFNGAAAVANTSWPAIQAIWWKNLQMMSDTLNFGLQSMSDNLNNWLITTSAYMVANLTGHLQIMRDIALGYIQPIIDAVVHLYELIAGVPNAAGGVPMPGSPGGGSTTNNSSSSTNNSNNTSTVTNNYYGYGGSVEAGATAAMAGAF